MFLPSRPPATATGPGRHTQPSVPPHLRSLEAALREPSRAGRKVVVLGNHDFTRFRWRERPLGADLILMTLIIRSDPPLLVTHVPLVVVPDGCVNVHGHHHDFRPLETGPWINVSVEQTGYRPLDVRTQVLPLARTLISGRTPDGATTIDRIGRASQAAAPLRAVFPAR